MKPNESSEPVIVLETSDPAMLAVAKSLLEEARIEFFAKGEGVQDLFAWGRFGTGFNPVVGPVQLQVAAEDAEQAAKVLSDLTAPGHDR
jgi:Putative prokaryotic signal transducing protein